MTLNFNIKQKRYTYSNLQLVLNNVELVSIGKKKVDFLIFATWFRFCPPVRRGKISKHEGDKLIITYDHDFDCINYVNMNVYNKKSMHFMVICKRQIMDEYANKSNKHFWTLMACFENSKISFVFPFVLMNKFWKLLYKRFLTSN